MGTFFRGRRLRRSSQLRMMIQEVALRPQDFIMPYFIVDTEDKNFSKPIASMPGQYQFSMHLLEEKIKEAVQYGLVSILLFGVPTKKDPLGSEAYDDNGIIQKAIRLLKKSCPEVQIITDVCLCEYTSHGHCGVLEQSDVAGGVLNDPTLTLLEKVALSHVQAGADMIAPSDMMDGRIQKLRSALDREGFNDIPIMSYAVKYASAYYGPFREAAESAPKSGDRKTYQMDPANSDEALREARADISEGADIIIVKPAGPYQDIIMRIKDTFDVPIAAYQVSGEYSVIKAAGMQGWIDEKAVLMESLLGIRRAGAKLIITYFAEEILRKRWV